MPSYCIHEHIALSAPREYSEGARCALIIGSYGPDALYYHDPLSQGRLSNIGQLLHNTRTDDFLTALLRCGGESQNARAYALGFISHYAADVIFHPFVYALSMTQDGYSGIKHLEVERALDKWIADISGSARHEMHPDEGSLRDAARCFCLALAQWEPQISIRPADAAQAFRLCARMDGLMGRVDDVHPSVKLLRDDASVEITPDELQAFALRGWRHPWTGEISCDGPFELLGEALKLSRSLMEIACRFWRGEASQLEFTAASGDRSYLSGIEWQRSEKLHPIEMERLRRLRSALFG